MRYFANPCGDAVIAAMGKGSLGLIDTPGQDGRARVRDAHAAGALWIADNGCFGSSYPGDDAWFAWLTRQAVHAATCLFATAPDVVGDAWRSHLRSAPWLQPIRDLGYPVAYVAQDGLESLPVPWHDFDALFIGGTTAWKLGPHARALVREARRRGKHVHMGRVNSRRRWVYAQEIGCDSVDGTFLTFGPRQLLPVVIGWTRTNDDLSLFDDEWKAAHD